MLQRTPTVRYRHDPQKSCAAQRLNGSHVHLVYIGPRHPNFRPMLSVKDAGRIHFAESQPETQAAAYLQHCDAPSCPPRDDLVNLANPEALRSGLPVAASEVCAIPETIRTTGAA